MAVSFVAPTSPATGDPATALWADGVATDLATPGWTALTLSASWVAFGAPEETPQYQVRCGFVVLAGTMKSGTTGAFATLPTGFRPLGTLLFNVNSAAAGGVATITVSSAGVMTLTGYAAIGSNASVSLNGITFIAEQ